MPSLGALFAESSQSSDSIWRNKDTGINTGFNGLIKLFISFKGEPDCWIKVPPFLSEAPHSLTKYLEYNTFA